MSSLKLDESSVNQCFRDQYGLITRHQALKLGLSERQIDYRIHQGDWIRLYPGVYRHAVAVPEFKSNLLAATLHTKGVASHRCAASLWGLEIYDQPPIEVTVDKPLRSRHTVRLHQSTQWHLRDETVRHGIPCTGIGRTLLDCAAVVSFNRLERLCEAAIRKRLIGWEDLAVTLRDHSRQGRNGCGPMRALLEARLGTGTIPLSDFSRLIVQLLEDAGLPSPVVEHRILDDNGGLVLQVDLAWPRLQKAWELDGLAFHFGRNDIERDKRKRNRAKALGWNIQEILWSMYIDDPAHLVDMARKFLNA